MESKESKHTGSAAAGARIGDARTCLHWGLPLKTLEHGQGEGDHVVAAGQREADVARQPHDLPWHHQHLFFHELPRKLNSAEASWAPR